MQIKACSSEPRVISAPSIVGLKHSIVQSKTSGTSLSGISRQLYVLGMPVFKRDQWSFRESDFNLRSPLRFILYIIQLSLRSGIFIAAILSPRLKLLSLSTHRASKKAYSSGVSIILKNYLFCIIGFFFNGVSSNAAAWCMQADISRLCLIYCLFASCC